MAIHSSIPVSESPEQRILASYSAWGHKEPDTNGGLALSPSFLSKDPVCRYTHIGRPCLHRFVP